MHISKASKRMAAEPSKYRTLQGQRTDPAVAEAISLGEFLHTCCGLVVGLQVLCEGEEREEREGGG